MERLKDKVNTIIPIIDNVKEYFNELAQYSSKSGSQIIQGLDQLDSLRSKLLDRMTVDLSKQTLDYDKKATIVFQIFEIMQRYENVIREVENLISGRTFTLDMFASNITRTKGNEIIDRGVSLLGSLLKHNKTFDLKEPILYFIGLLSDAKLQDLKTLNNLFEKYPQTIELYGQLMQTLINKNKDFLYPILDQIEYHKTRVLDRSTSSSSISSLTISLPPGGQYSFKCFNLVPNSPPAKVNLSQLIKSHNVIVLVKQTKTYTIIDGWKDWQAFPAVVSKELIEAGKILEIAQLPKGGNKFTFEIHEHKKADTWIVLDTFDGERFRYLKPWANETHVVRENHIRGLLTYLGYIKPITTVKLSRATNINLIQQEGLAKGKIAPIDIEKLVREVEHEVDAPKLKQSINTKMLKIPHKSVVDLLNNPKLIDVLVEHVRPPSSIIKQKNPETHMTYMIELGLLKRRFIKSVFSKYAILKDISCIRAALDDVITNSANIHRSILYKKDLLSKIRIS